MKGLIRGMIDDGCKRSIAKYLQLKGPSHSTQYILFATI